MFRGSNVIGQINIIINNMYLVGNPLQAMTALSLDLVDISRDWVSFFVMLSQVFTADDFRCCWFVGLSVFSFVFSEWNAAQSGWDQETDRISHFFTFKNSWVAFAVCRVCVFVHLYYNASWIPVHFSIHPAASVFCSVSSSSSSSLNSSNQRHWKSCMLIHLYYNASWIPVHFSILFIFYSVFHSSFYSSGCFCLLFCLIIIIIIIIITKPQ